MYAWHGIHHYTQLMHGSERLGSPFYNNSRSSKICQAYKTCSFIKYKSKNVKCARVYKQCQERCLNSLVSVNNYKCWKIYHDRHVFCLYFWQSRCKLFFKTSILASLDPLGNMHIIWHYWCLCATTATVISIFSFGKLQKERATIQQKEKLKNKHQNPLLGGASNGQYWFSPSTLQKYTHAVCHISK